MHVKDSALTASCWLRVNRYLQLHCDNTTEHCDKVVIPREITANQLTNRINARIKKSSGPWRNYVSRLKHIFIILVQNKNIITPMTRTGTPHRNMLLNVFYPLIIQLNHMYFQYLGEKRCNALHLRNLKFSQ